MSTTLCWRQILSGKSLPDDLKYKLQKKYQFPRIFDASDIPYIDGLIDCEIEGALKLKELIEKHEEIELMLEY